MGQYYKPINLDRKESLYSHDYNNGLKLMEHSWVGNKFVGTVMFLLYGSWSGNRILWAGDYAEPEVKGTEFYMEERENGNDWDRLVPMTLFHWIDVVGKEIHPNDLPVRYPMVFQYLINLDKKLYVDLNKVPITEHCGWQIHPLPLLTAEGNGGAGGDFKGKDPDNLIGSWARDRLTADNTLEKYKDFKEILFNLVE